MSTERNSKHMSEENSNSKDSELADVDKEKKMSRRSFLVTSAGAGAAVLGTGAIMNFVLVGDRPDGADKGEDVGAFTSSISVMPASSYAQSVLLGLCPRSLVSLCEEANVYESAGLSDSVSLTLTGAYEGTNKEEFIKQAIALKPDLILDVGHYDDSWIGEIETLRSRTSIHCESLSFTNDGFEEMILSAAGLLGVELSDEIRSNIRVIGHRYDSLGLSGDADKIIICPCGGDDGMFAYGSDSVYGKVFDTSVTQCVDLSGASAYSSPADTAALVPDDFLYGSVSAPDIVFLISAEASCDYLDEKELGCWRILEPGRLGYVFPMLIGKYAWFDELSPFAKDVIASYWLYSLFTWDDRTKLESDSQSLFEFYQDFYGTELVENTYAESYMRLIQTKLPISRDQILKEKAELANQSEQTGEAISDALDEEPEYGEGWKD